MRLQVGNGLFLFYCLSMIDVKLLDTPINTSVERSFRYLNCITTDDVAIN